MKLERFASVVRVDEAMTHNHRWMEFQREDVRQPLLDEVRRGAVVVWPSVVMTESVRPDEEGGGVEIRLHCYAYRPGGGA